MGREEKEREERAHVLRNMSLIPKENCYFILILSLRDSQSCPRSRCRMTCFSQHCFVTRAFAVAPRLSCKISVNITI